MEKAIFVLALLFPLPIWAQAKPETPTQAARVQPAGSPAKKIEVPDLSPAVVVQHERIVRLVGPKTKEKASQVAVAFSARARRLAPNSDFYGLAAAEVRSSFRGSGNLSNENIDALVEMLMMQAAQDTQSDLRNIIAATEKENQQKQGVRKNSVGEMSETQSLRLQMTMDRYSKFMETLSNIEKKVAQTQDSVVQNMK